MKWGALSKEQLMARGLFFDVYNINAAIEGLKKLEKIFDKYNIPFFLDCGTLLGCIRDGEFINIDIDVDIGVLGEHWNEKIDKEFKAGFWVRSSGTKICGQRVADLYFGGSKKAGYFGCVYFKDNSHIPIDVYILHKGAGKFEGKRINTMTGRTYDLSYFKSFTEKKLHGANFYVPVEYEKYLDDIYVGRKNWITPLL